MGLALLLGTGLGLLGLVPGLHYAMVLLFSGPWVLDTLGLEHGIVALVWSVGIARCMRTLTVVYHPVAADNLASADPAQRLRAAGQGKLATRIMSDGLWLAAVVVVVLVALGLLGSRFVGFDLFRAYLKGLSWISLPAFVGWFGFLVYRAKNKFSTVLVFAATGVLGAIALTHPSVRGSGVVMTPLLTGLFGLPILLLTLVDSSSSNQPSQAVHLEPVPERDHPDELSWFGLFTGILSVTLPGLGTSSLISVGQDLAKDDAQYLRMAAVAESTGELLALCLGILLIADRSSDAAVISRLTTTTAGEYALGPQFPWAMLATLLAACWVGLRLTYALGFPYRLLMYAVPNKLQALAVAVGMVWIVWSHTGGWGIGVMLAGVLIHIGARRLGVPNQAFFACMVIPMCLSILNLNPLGS